MLSPLKTPARRGQRLTPARQAILKVLGRSPTPQSPQEILHELKKFKLTINKTTVYRQLESLLSRRLIRAIHLGERSVRYELAHGLAHHHHLVCLDCGKITNIFFPTDLKKQEETIWKKNKFEIFEHSLEFFGRCRTCAEKLKKRPQHKNVPAA